MYKIAIAGASSLLGRELKDALGESAFETTGMVLLDSAPGHGKLEQVGDEIAIVQAIGQDSFEHIDFTFFCGAEDLTQRYWRDALRAGSTVLDLSGALDRETGVLVRAPWIGSTADPDLFTPAIVPAAPAAVTIALLLERLQLAAEVKIAAATVLVPASEFGQPAMDELHQQTVNLLSFQPLPRAVFDAQAAYNLLCGFGENAGAGHAALSGLEARIRRHFLSLCGGRGPALALQAIQAPVFHGLALSIAVELDRLVELSLIEDALVGENLELILEDTDSPSNLAATGQNGILVRLRPEKSGRNPNEASRIWLWAAIDNLRLHARNAVECALELRRLRPQGKVQ